MRVLSRVLVMAVLVGSLTLATSAVTSAAVTLQPANCNYNYDTAKTSIVVRAPKITSNNGGTQSVRYRSFVYRLSGSNWIKKATGAWHTGSATPSRPYVDSARTWQLNPYGSGHYRTLIQVQYYNGSWGGTTNRFVLSYYLNYFYDGTWHYQNTYNNCWF